MTLPRSAERVLHCPSMNDAVASHYAALQAKVDAFVARVEASHRADMQCASGCATCCLTELSLLSIEAALVTAAIADLTPLERDSLAERAARKVDPTAPRCAALDDDDRCSIYAARPLLCRSHGVPIRVKDPRGLPMIDACFKNFVSDGPEAVPATDVLDQATLSTVLLALDAAHAQDGEATAGDRISLRRVIADACAKS